MLFFPNSLLLLPCNLIHNEGRNFKNRGLCEQKKERTGFKSLILISREATTTNNKTDSPRLYLGADMKCKILGASHTYDGWKHKQKSMSLILKEQLFPQQWKDLILAGSLIFIRTFILVNKRILCTHDIITNTKI